MDMGMMKQIWDEIESDKDLSTLSDYATSLQGKSELDDAISEALMSILIEVAHSRLKSEN